MKKITVLLFVMIACLCLLSACFDNETASDANGEASIRDLTDEKGAGNGTDDAQPEAQPDGDTEQQAPADGNGEESNAPENGDDDVIEFPEVEF